MDIFDRIAFKQKDMKTLFNEECAEADEQTGKVRWLEKDCVGGAFFGYKRLIYEHADEYLAYAQQNGAAQDYRPFSGHHRQIYPDDGEAVVPGGGSVDPQISHNRSVGVASGVLFVFAAADRSGGQASSFFPPPAALPPPTECSYTVHTF